MRAKSLDTFCPLGPKVVELDDPQNLKLQTRVNGEVMQDSNTNEMIFGVAELISFCSHSFALEPGDVDAHRHAVGLRRVHGAQAFAEGR